MGGFYLFNFNLSTLDQFVGESKNLRRNVLDSIGFDKSFSNLSNTSGIVLEDDCWFVILSESTLFQNYLVHVPEPYCLPSCLMEGNQFGVI